MLPRLAPFLFANSVLFTTFAPTNPKHFLTMSDLKRREHDASDKQEGESGVQKRRRVTDYFHRSPKPERIQSQDSNLRDMSESAIRKLEAGNIQFGRLHLDDQGAYLSYYPSLADAVSSFPRKQLEGLKQQLLLEPGGPSTILPWSQGRLKVYGKEHQERRFTCFFADSSDRTYSYSGRKDLKVFSWSDASVCPPQLNELRKHISELCGCHFDTALLNFYRDGEDCIGWHADDEAIYGGKSDAKSIVGVSFGAERDFQIRPKPSKRNPPQAISQTRDKLSITLRGEGSVIVMGGAMQQHWQHSVPPRKRVSAPRVSVTFRRVPSSSPEPPKT